MVMIKLLIIVLVIIVGCFHVDIDNWTPLCLIGFNGSNGRSISSVFGVHWF